MTSQVCQLLQDSHCARKVHLVPLGDHCSDAAPPLDNGDSLLVGSRTVVGTLIEKLQVHSESEIQMVQSATPDGVSAGEIVKAAWEVVE